MLFITEERHVKQENQSRRVIASFGTIMGVMNRSFIEGFLEMIDTYADEFGIKGYHLVDKVRLKPLDKRLIIEELWLPNVAGRDLPWIYFAGRKPYDFDLSIHVEDGKVAVKRYNMTVVRVRVDRDYFIATSEEEQKRRLDTYLALCRDIYRLTKPLCGECHDADDEDAISVSLSKRGLFRFLGFAYSAEYGHIEQPHIDCPISGIYWANYFGPSCIEFFGHEKLLNAPGVVNREELEGGGMLLFTAPHPLTPDDPVHRANQLALWNYLGLNPEPNLKVIAKYKSPDPWKGAKPIFEP
jgi:hypothetical protein